MGFCLGVGGGASGGEVPVVKLLMLGIVKLFLLIKGLGPTVLEKIYYTPPPI